MVALYSNCLDGLTDFALVLQAGGPQLEYITTCIL